MWALMIVDAFALFLDLRLSLPMAFGNWPITIGSGHADGQHHQLAASDLYALRWIAPALSLMCLLVVYPYCLHRCMFPFTNYGDGNLADQTAGPQAAGAERHTSRKAAKFTGWDALPKHRG